MPAEIGRPWSARPSVSSQELGLADEAPLRAAAVAPELQKRTAYARAVARDPRVLLVEDPSALLDPEGRELVAQLHKRLARDGTTVLLADDDMVFAAELTRRAVVLEGRTIRYDGSFAELPREVAELFPGADEIQH